MARERQVTMIALFRQIGRLMVDDLVTRMQRKEYSECTATHHAVFEVIDPGGTRLTVLAERTGMTHQSMSELVATIERLGYVERTADPSDGRARLVTLTDRGRQLTRSAMDEVRDIERQWTKLLTDAGLSGDLRAAFAVAVNAYTQTLETG